MHIFHIIATRCGEKSVLMTEQWYLYGSVIIGLCQMVGAGLWLSDAKRYQRFILCGSLLEYVWAGVSYWMTKQTLSGFPVELPITFVAYTLAFMAAGVVLAVQSRHEAEPQIPAHVIWAGGLFGAGFASVSAYTLITTSVGG